MKGGGEAAALCELLLFDGRWRIRDVYDLNGFPPVAVSSPLLLTLFIRVDLRICILTVPCQSYEAFFSTCFSCVVADFTHLRKIRVYERASIAAPLVYTSAIASTAVRCHVR